MSTAPKTYSLFATVSRRGDDIAILPWGGGEHVLPGFFQRMHDPDAHSELIQELTRIQLPIPEAYVTHPDEPTELDIVYTHTHGRFLFIKGGSPPQQFGVQFRTADDGSIDSPEAAAHVMAYLCIPLLFPEYTNPSNGPSLQMDDDLDEPLGPACSLDNPNCESCQ